jgi:hypothetical protein
MLAEVFIYIQDSVEEPCAFEKYVRGGIIKIGILTLKMEWK